MGEGSGPGSPKPPLKGTLRDVEVGSMTELISKVDQWLGSPGEWRLNTAANWPLQEELLHRPTSSSCPLLVNVVDSPQKLRKDVDSLTWRLTQLELKLDRAEDKKSADDKQLGERLDRLAIADEYWELIKIGGSADGNVGAPLVRSGRSGHCGNCGASCMALSARPAPLSVTLLTVLLFTILAWFTEARVDTFQSKVNQLQQQMQKQIQEQMHQQMGDLRTEVWQLQNKDQLEQKKMRQLHDKMSDMSSDITILKANMSNIFQDVNVLYVNVSNISRNMSLLYTNVSNVSQNMSMLVTWMGEAETSQSKLHRRQQILVGKLDQMRDELKTVVTKSVFNSVNAQVTKVAEGEGELQSTVKELKQKLQKSRNETFDLKLAQLNQTSQLRRTMRHVRELQKQSREANASLEWLDQHFSQLRNQTLLELRTEIATELRPELASLEDDKRKAVEAEHKVNIELKQVRKSIQAARENQQSKLGSIEFKLKQQQTRELQFSKRLDSIEAKLQNMNASEAKGAQSLQD